MKKLKTANTSIHKSGSTTLKKTTLTLSQNLKKDLTILKILPISSSKSFLACHQGLYMLQTTAPSSLNLTEIIPSTEFRDLIYFSKRNLLYAYSYKENKIFTIITTTFDFFSRRLDCYCDPDSKGKNLRGDFDEEILFFLMGKKLIGVFDVKEDFEWIVSNGVGIEPERGIYGFENLICFGALFVKKLMKIEKKRNREKGIYTSYDFEISENQQNGVEKKKKKIKKKSKIPEEKKNNFFGFEHSEENSRTTLEESQDKEINFFEYNERNHSSKILFVIDEIPCEAIRDFQIIPERSLILLISTTQNILIIHYTKKNFTLKKNINLNIKNSAYSISICPKSTYIVISSTNLTLNLSSLLLLEIDENEEIKEKSFIDFTTNFLYNESFSCFGFVDLYYNFEGNLVIFAGQEFGESEALFWVFEPEIGVLKNIAKFRDFFGEFLYSGVRYKKDFWVGLGDSSVVILRGEGSDVGLFIESGSRDKE